MKVLIVGGAGFIGSHAARRLVQAGHEAILFDSLATGHAEVADRLSLPLLVGDLAHPNDLDAAFARSRVDAVMHFAAFCYVGESVQSPSKYYINNVAGTLNLLEAMRRHGVERIVFSSSCATYGMPQRPTLDERHPQLPVSPYGRTKLINEHMLRDYGAAYGIRFVSLRYFNAAGAAPDGLIGEDHDPETHLIPLCLLAAAKRTLGVTVFGTDYPTADGTCIRDYIHVDDLARAHVLALEHLADGGESLELNVGAGRGFSVREVIACAERVTCQAIPVATGPRRVGDPPILVAAADQIRQSFGWRPDYDALEPIVATAWNWFRAGGRYA